MFRDKETILFRNPSFKGDPTYQTRRRVEVVGEGKMSKSDSPSSEFRPRERRWDRPPLPKGPRDGEPGTDVRSSLCLYGRSSNQYERLISDG